MIRLFNGTYKLVRRAVIAVVGITVLLLGVIMIVTPGPALLLIPGGLAILGIEFAWARYLLRRARRTISDQGARVRGKRANGRRRASGEDGDAPP